jgi:hypothetical protein
MIEPPRHQGHQVNLKSSSFDEIFFHRLISELKNLIGKMFLLGALGALVVNMAFFRILKYG